MLDDFEKSGALEEIKGTPEVLRRLRDTLGSTFLALGDYENAEYHSKMALDLAAFI